MVKSAHKIYLLLEVAPEDRLFEKVLLVRAFDGVQFCVVGSEINFGDEVDGAEAALAEFLDGIEAVAA